jgi:tetratricopeptide (TPR) repeat protein
MKNILKISILIFALFVSNNLHSQSLRAYTLKLPPKVFTGGGKLYVKALKSENGKFTDFGIQVSEAIKNQLITANNKNREIKASGSLYNPWFTTKLYEIVNSENQADIILGGSYKLTAQQDTSAKIHSDTTWVFDNGTVNKKPLTYFYFEYQNKGKISVNGQIIAKRNGQVIDKHDFSDKLEGTKRSFLNKPKGSSIDSLVKKITARTANSKKNLYSPEFVLEKYNFKNVKTKNKAYKSELKSQMKIVKANLKSRNLNAAAKILFQLNEKESSDNLYYNLGLCYELIGNTKKAAQFYEKSGNSSGIKRINRLMQTEKLIESLGLPIIEKDFDF